MEYNETKGTCPENHLQENQCRKNNTVYKVIDYCLAGGDPKFIKKELLKNGPVISQIAVYTDFLPYREGLYHRTEDAFKFNGMHIVKLLGWEKSPDG